MDFFYSIFAKVYNLLPDCPFGEFLKDNPISSEWLHYINWFIPFDLCFKITESWVIAIAVFYLFTIVKKIALDYLVGSVSSFLKK